jgi:hypothetical protein
MALKTIGDFDQGEVYGWQAPITPTDFILNNLKEGVLSESSCRHIDSCQCPKKHYMWPMKARYSD